MRTLTMDEVGFVSGGIKDPRNNPTQPRDPAAEVGTGTVKVGSGPQVGMSINKDGSINLGAGVGMGIEVSDETIKNQGLELNFSFNPKNLPQGLSKEELKKFIDKVLQGESPIEADAMIWLGAATQAEREAFWGRIGTPPAAVPRF